MFVLVHSPLVGPLTWQAVAGELRTRGRPAVVPSLTHALTSGPPYHKKLADAVADAVRAQGGQSPLVLVGHSGAGALLPAVADALDAPVAATVFVDAVLPHPGVTWLHGAPAELAAQLRSLARDGVLPPWDRWFAPELLAQLLPEPGLRARFVAELPTLPLAYFQEPAPVSRRWPAGTGAYLQLSEAYDEPAARARACGWPVERLQAHHLAMLTAPAQILSALDRLVATRCRKQPEPLERPP